MTSVLKLSDCSITKFPELIKHQQKLTNLDLSNNNIQDQVPGWLWNLPELSYVDLSKNIAISFEKSSYNFSKMPSIFDLPSPLRSLTLSASNITSVPEFIKRHKTLSSLDFSNNKIKGQVPGWLWTLPYLMHMDLSNKFFNGFEESTKPKGFSFPETSMKYLLGSKNNFAGEILRSLDVSHNQLVGKLPRSLIRFSTLEVLNVGNNAIQDTFPFWLSSLQKLQVLVLRSNAFHGPIEKTLFSKLRIIDISHNHFNGTLPPDSFVKWSDMSSLGTNEDGSNLKYMEDEYGYYHDSVVLVNKGVELEFVRILKIYTALDFFVNKFEGEIPRSIGLLTELHTLNLSNNAFIGHIPSSIANLIKLESLDVSQNKLTGEIPQGLGVLSYLLYMNFSHNQLVSPVPRGTQFRRQPCSSFEDNPGLYGPSLDEVCVDIHASQQSETPEPEKDEEEDLSWIAAAIGFGPGIAFGLMIGYILFSYKLEWCMHTFGQNNRRSLKAH